MAESGHQGRNGDDDPYDYHKHEAAYAVVYGDIVVVVEELGSEDRGDHYQDADDKCSPRSGGFPRTFAYLGIA